MARGPVGPTTYKGAPPSFPQTLAPPSPILQPPAAPFPHSSARHRTIFRRGSTSLSRRIEVAPPWRGGPPNGSVMRWWRSSRRVDGGAPTSGHGDAVGGGGAPASMARRPLVQRCDDDHLFFLLVGRSTTSATSSAALSHLLTSPIAGRINRIGRRPPPSLPLATLIGSRAGTGQMAHRAYCRASGRANLKN
jgi:hypothetical protein